MRYVDEFRNPAAAAALAEMIRDARPPAGKTVRIMEVCGSHTNAIAKYGIRGLLPENVDLLSGPGCPICVTAAGYVDAACDLAEKGLFVHTFGDMLNVRGSHSSLGDKKAAGRDVHVCYSPVSALDFAAASPSRETVFLAVGFETTIPGILTLLDSAVKKGAGNFSILCSFKRIPPALEILLSDEGSRVDALLCPAHVSAIIGAAAYEPVARGHGVPCVIAGFEPLDILNGIHGALRQLREGRAVVENQYARVVRDHGNPAALALIEKYLEPCDSLWRGMGMMPQCGYRLKKEFSTFDAAARFGVEVGAGVENPACRCGDILRGRAKPPECPLFGGACTPAGALGPCMVSGEGACAAWLRHGGV